jgi:hypothetical protein
MKLQERYLHFDNLDMQQPVISSQCNECGKEFNAERREGEHIDDLLIRVRAKFEAHVCES